MNESTLLDCHLRATYLCRIIRNHPFRVHTDQADNYTLHTYTHTHTHAHTHTEEPVTVAAKYSLIKKHEH